MFDPWSEPGWQPYGQTYVEAYPESPAYQPFQSGYNALLDSLAESEQEPTFAGMADILNSSTVWGEGLSALVAEVVEKNNEGLAAMAMTRANESQKTDQGESADIPAKAKDFDGTQRTAGMKDREPFVIVPTRADIMVQVLLMSLLGRLPLSQNWPYRHDGARSCFDKEAPY